ncbi:MAG: phage integrase SAM-like domain-containing protein [Planctomycetes bacterium]|nr:phage integrase SAM-like domain-containing protein [Planctomycetota bacterium]
MSLIQYFPNLKEYIPEGIRINQITAGHAKEFHEKLKARGMATTTIHKRIQFARQFMHDAVDKLMKKANLVWQVILGLSRYGGLRTPSETLSLPSIELPLIQRWAGRTRTYAPK